MKNKIGELKLNVAHHGLALDLIKKLPDESVHSVITSSPYYFLRDYGYSEQWGQESTYQEFLENIWSLMDEIKRVLKPNGTVFWNISDTYARGSRNKDGKNHAIQTNSKENHIEPKGKPNYQKLNKTLLLIPHRFAIGCIDRGWKIRNNIIWAIRNKKPESMKSRFSRKHEFIFFMVKQDDHYFDLNSIKDPLSDAGIKRALRGMSNNNKYSTEKGTDTLNKYRKKITDPKEKLKKEIELKAKGKNPGNITSLWYNYKDISLSEYLEIAKKDYLNGDIFDIPNTGTRLKHFAAYSTNLMTKLVLSGSPENGIILDPFCGTSTTGVKAIELNRQFIGFDGSKEYIKMSNKRLKEVLNNKTNNLF